jgi:GMP synthase (glutamine-hydrolysing)
MSTLVIQHGEDEPPGLIGAALGRFDVCRTWRGEPVPETLTHDALVVLGGTMAAWDDERHPHLAGEARLLAAYTRAGRPTLGICLGSQLLARGLGARNFRGPGLEKGLLPVTLTEDGRSDALLHSFDGATVVQWHEDTFSLPGGAAWLASSASYPHQAFRVGERAWGLQFHVECDRAMRLSWGFDAAPAEIDERIDARGRALAQQFAALVISSPRR